MSNRLEALETLMQQDPKDAFVRYGLANEYFKASRYEECIEQIKAYLSLADDEGAVYRILAKAWLKLGNIEEARRAYELGINAAERHNHPSMAEEYREAIEYDLD